MKRFKMKMSLLLTLAVVLAGGPGTALSETANGKKKPARVVKSKAQKPRSWVRVRPVAEMGFLSVPRHVIQFGRNGTRFDYVADGSQNNLFFFARVSATFVLFKRHHIKFLYQPLDLRTRAKAKRDINIGGVVFPERTPMDLRYGFDFYRLTYLYQFLDRWGWEMAVGLGVQLRNARITFTSADGALRYTNGNIGPVPLISLRVRYNINRLLWLETEVDGFYADTKYVNGGDDPVTGAILDASLRLGFNAHRRAETFLNVRYLGGGARGSSDIYTNNWLHTIAVTVGVGLK